MFKKLSKTQWFFKLIASCGVTAILVMAITDAGAAGANKSSGGSAAHTTVTRVDSRTNPRLAVASKPAPVKKTVASVDNEQDVASSDSGDDDENDTLKLSAKKKPKIIVKPANG